jgi:cysteine-rich repeat protein
VVLKTWREGVWAVVFVASSFAVGCGSDRTFSPHNGAGAGGSAGNGGNSGKGGTAGHAGSSAGHAGSSNGGSSGSSQGSGGSGGDVSSGVGGSNRGGTGGTGTGGTGGSGAIDATGGAGEAGSGAQAGDAGGGGAPPRPVCGNGTIDGDDVCDDGNTKAGDGCSATCTVEAGWNCDAQGCTEICGDGVVVGHEALAGGCDDKNAVASDGCTNCVVDTSYVCAGAPSVCAKTCGDGIVEGSEVCDDGNAMPNDGCFACAVETGYTCDTKMPTTCADIDECTKGTDDCDANAACANSIGSFTCTCNNGYKGSGKTCTDKDECGADGGNNCGANTNCTNTPGSFSCACKTGYKGTPTAGCTDKDECGADGGNNCGANTTCTNTPGSFSCACKTGYKGDPVAGCTDKDECGADGGNNCSTNANCANTTGSFSCTCKTGYMGNGTTCSACSCGAYSCSSTACKTSCSADSDCATNYFCSGSTCKVSAVQISVADTHACITLADGTVRCWGVNADRELGSTSSSNSTTPVQVQSISTAKVVAAGQSQTVALLANGSAVYWGKRMTDYNYSSSTPTYTTSATPTAIAGLSTSTDIVIADSDFGATCTLVNDGSIRCWGMTIASDNNSSQFLSSPTNIGITGATGLSSGDNFQCFAMAAGNVKCWGFGNEGAPLGSSGSSYTPVTVDVGGTVSKIHSGGYFSCVLLTTDKVKCWGSSSNYQVNSAGDFAVPTPTLITGLSSVKDFACGSESSCAVDTSGGVKCWGDDQAGELGDNNPNPGSAAPVSVQNLAGPAAAVGVGNQSACAVLKNGSVQCWGRSIGDLSSSNALTPVTVW